MEALSKIQETERVLQLLEDATKQLKDKLGEDESDLSGLAEILDARNKEAAVLIKGLEGEIESLSDENRRLKELEDAVPSVRKALENELSAVKRLEEQLTSKDQENSCLKDEMDSLKERENELSAQMETQNVEINSLKSDKELLQEKVSEIEKQLHQDTDVQRKEKEILQAKLLQRETMLAKRENEVSELKRKLIDTENDTSGRIEALITQMNALQQDINVERESSIEKLSLVANENAELMSKVSDQESILQEQEDTIISLRGGSDQAMVQLEQAVDRKIAAMGKEFRKNFEADIMIMKQRIRVAEQVQTETKENCMRIKERCEQDHSGLDKKVKVYSRMIALSKGEVTKFFNAANETLTGLESSFNKFGAMEADFSGRIARIIDEIIAMKNVIKKKTESIPPVSAASGFDGNDSNKELRVLEEMINKEEEDLNSMKRVDELQRRVDELEKSGMEKEETIFELVEKKKEAIRQLCISVEYYQNRCDQLVNLLSNSNKSRRGRRRA